MADTKRYGTPREPETREWGYVDSDKSVQTFVFHPRYDVEFADIVKFGTLRADYTNQARDDAKQMVEDLRVIAVAQATMVNEDGEEPRPKRDDEEQIDDEEAKIRFKKVTDRYTDKEGERFKANVELALFLVHEADREALRPLLLKGHPLDIVDLVEDLRKDVINKAAARAEAVMGLPPTSPASQPT